MEIADCGFESQIPQGDTSLSEKETLDLRHYFSKLCALETAQEVLIANMKLQSGIVVHVYLRRDRRSDVFLGRGALICRPFFAPPTPSAWRFCQVISLISNRQFAA